MLLILQEELPQPDGEPFDGQATVQYLANGSISLFNITL